MNLSQNLGKVRESIYFDFAEREVMEDEVLPLCVGFAELGLTQAGYLIEMTQQQCV